eukprot:scaffold25259_cov142-Isochrysis_galbana.AAC.1
MDRACRRSEWGVGGENEWANTANIQQKAEQTRRRERTAPAYLTEKVFTLNTTTLECKMSQCRTNWHWFGEVPQRIGAVG